MCSLILSTKSSRDPACAGVPNGEFVRNSESCSAYYYCNNERAIRATCPAPFVFEPRNQVCDNSFSVDCTVCSPRGIQNLEDPNDCRRFFHCAAGIRTHRFCSEGLVFDPRIGDCNLESLAPCKVNNNVCRYFLNIPFIQIGDPQDCTRLIAAQYSFI